MDAFNLALHLLAEENEEVTVLELRDVGATNLPDALEEMRLVSIGARTRRALYHASINLDADEARSLTPKQWHQAADELERRLGLSGHQRAMVRHVKHGRVHVHVVWSRIDPVSMTATHDGQNYRRHEDCARSLERRWHLRPVVGAHTRAPGSPRPVAVSTHRDWQAQERTGILVKDVANKLRKAWNASKSGKAFRRAVENEGLCLASGRRGIVVVDAAGTPHSIPRRVGIKAAEVTKKLADLDPLSLPSVDDAKAAASRRPTMRIAQQKFGARRDRRRSLITGAEIETAEIAPIPPRPEYWNKLGYDTEKRDGTLIVILPRATEIEDRGDTLTLITSGGEPTGEEIRLLVAAGRDRGWQKIHFWGSEEFQLRARAEALRQGYSLDEIILECEDEQERPAVDAGPMPEHIRRRLAPPSENVPDVTTPIVKAVPKAEPSLSR